MNCGKSSPAPGPSVPRRVASDESGQILLMTGVLIGVMIVLVALVVDIGHTRLVQRQLQAGVDAAALAGAQELPVETRRSRPRTSTAPLRRQERRQHGRQRRDDRGRALHPDDPGLQHALRDGERLSVTSTSNVPTFFARIIGVKSLTVTAKATACFPCSIRPLDIMLVLDRTGSMCDTKDATASAATSKRRGTASRRSSR